jgi:hypothetical protein
LPHADTLPVKAAGVTIRAYFARFPHQSKMLYARRVTHNTFDTTLLAQMDFSKREQDSFAYRSIRNAWTQIVNPLS